MKLPDTDPRVFACPFLSLLEEYWKNPAKGSLEISQSGFGQVSVMLIDRVAQTFRDAVTPARFNPVGLTGYIWPIAKVLCPSSVIVNLFLKTVGLPYETSYGVETIHAALSAAQTDFRKIADTLEPLITFHSMVNGFKSIPVSKACEEFCVIPSSRCVVFRNDLPVASLDDNLARFLWRVIKPQERPEAIPPFELLVPRIAGANDDDSRLLRAIAVSMSAELTSSFRKYFELLVQPPEEAAWRHTMRAEIQLDIQTVVTQHITSQIGRGQSSLLLIQWRVSIAFDEKMFPQSIRCMLDNAGGVLLTPQMHADVMAQCSGEWSRSLTGNIEALFHCPNLSVALAKMPERQKQFLFLGEGAVLSLEEGGVQSGQNILLDPSFDSLLRFLKIPQQMLGDTRWVTDYEAVQAVSANLAGVLIAVSHLPFQEVSRFLEQAGVQIDPRWDHTSAQLSIENRDARIKVVHQGTSTSRNRAVTISWALEITLSPGGYPESCVFTPTVTGPLLLPRSLLLHRFLPPPLPTQNIPEMVLYKEASYIVNPSAGIVLNGRRITQELPPKAEALWVVSDGIVDLLSSRFRFSPPPSWQIPEQRRRWIVSDRSSCARLLRAIAFGLSNTAIYPVVEFLQRSQLPKAGETWAHDDIDCRITSEDDGVLVHRTIQSKCIFSYRDLYYRPRALVLAEAVWSFEIHYDFVGHPQTGNIMMLMQRKLDVSYLQNFQKSQFDRSWTLRVAYGIENIFKDPPLREQIIVDIVRKMRTLKILEQGMLFLGEKSSVLGLVERLGLSEEIQSTAHLEETFSVRLRAYSDNTTAWERVMRFLELPVNMPYSPENERIFFQCLKTVMGDSEELCSRVGKLKLTDEEATSASTTTSAPSHNESKRKEWEEIVKGLRLIKADSLTSALADRWRKQDAESREMRDLFLIGIGLNQAVTSCISNLFDLGRVCQPFQSIGDCWQHTLEGTEVNFWGTHGFEVTQRGSSVRKARWDDDRTGETLERELACVEWSLVTRFDEESRLIGIFTSIDGIKALNLTPAIVESTIAQLQSVWVPLKNSEETVIPFMAPTFKSQEIAVFFQNFIRVPLAFTESFLTKDNSQFLRNVQCSVMREEKFIFVLSAIESKLKKKYEGVPMNGFHLIQTNICLGNESKVSYSIATILYRIERKEGFCHFRRIDSVQWGIELLVNNTGNVMAVSIVNLNEQIFPTAMVKECERAFGQESTLAPMQYSMTVSTFPTF